MSYQINVYIQIYSYGDAMLKKDFAEDSLQHELDLSKPLDFTCPIRILHGLDDKVIKKGKLKLKLLVFKTFCICFVKFHDSSFAGS